MNTPQLKSITTHCISFVCLISLSTFALTSMAGQDIVLHKEIEAACTETIMTRQMYNMIPDMADIYSMGACPPVSSKGKKIFGG